MIKKSTYNDFRNQMRHGIEEKRKILNLQSKYENGEILEADLTANQKLKLEGLYNEQIKDLKDKIAKEEGNLKLKKELINKYSVMLKNCLMNK